MRGGREERVREWREKEIQEERKRREISDTNKGGSE
jgi:hypothetical protein